MTKARPRQQYLPPGTDPDSQPVPQCPPAPMAYSKFVSIPDGDLCLTPDKVCKEAGILKRGRGGKQTQRQVHFDVNPRTKSLAINPARVSGEKPGAITVISQPSCSPSELQRSLRTAVSEAGKGKKGLKKQKEFKPKSRKLASDRPSKVPTQSQEAVHCEGAELNTTLAIKAELGELAEAEFDSRKAVQEQLKKTHTKNNIAIKATEALNIPRSQNLYQALVSVSVSEDQLISHALRDRLTLAPASRSSRNQESPAEGPDLLAFYSAGELLRESPFIPEDEEQQSRPRPVPRPAHTTFDLFYRQRQWEA